MRTMNMHSVTIAEAFSAARRSDDLCTRHLITPLASGGSQRPQQEPSRDGWSTDRTKPKPQYTQPQPRAGSKRRGSNAREIKCQKVLQVSQGGNTRCGRAKRDNPSKLHQRHHGKSICFAFQNPTGCSKGNRAFTSTSVRIVSGRTALTSVDHTLKLVPPAWKLA